MREFGSWFTEQGKAQPEVTDERIWMECRGCGKSESVGIKEYENGDTGWYFDGEVEPDEAYRGVCGGSQYCVP